MRRDENAARQQERKHEILRTIVESFIVSVSLFDEFSYRVGLGVVFGQQQRHERLQRTVELRTKDFRAWTREKALEKLTITPAAVERMPL